MIDSGTGRVGGAGGYPAIGAGIVSSASIQIGSVAAAPDDHFTTCPNCCVRISRGWCVGGAGGCPAIGAGIVFAAGVKKRREAAVISSPDDHFTASPNSRVKVSAISRIAGTGGCPSIIDASVRPIRDIGSVYLPLAAASSGLAVP